MVWRVVDGLLAVALAILFVALFTAGVLAVSGGAS